jgi:ubiquinone biosynthesis protein
MQTKYDLFVIRKLIDFANYLCRKYDFQGIDFRKFNEHFQKSLVKELDFAREVLNAERTRKQFEDCKDLHIPLNKVDYSSSRAIVMEFVEGIKISDVEGLKA